MLKSGARLRGEPRETEVLLFVGLPPAQERLRGGGTDSAVTRACRLLLANAREQAGMVAHFRKPLGSRVVNIEPSIDFRPTCREMVFEHAGLSCFACPGFQRLISFLQIRLTIIGFGGFDTGLATTRDGRLRSTPISFVREAWAEPNGELVDQQAQDEMHLHGATFLGLEEMIQPMNLAKGKMQESRRSGHSAS